MKAKFALKTAPALGVAVAAALFAGGAWALPPATINSGTAAVIYFGGATATDTSLEEAFLLKTNGLCTNGNPAGDDFNAATRIDVYRGTNQRAIVCTKAATVGSTATQLVFLKESAGGSGNGTGAIASNTALGFLDLGGVTGAFSCTGATTNVSNTTTLLSYTNNTGCAPIRSGANGVVPEAGIADVEPALLNLTPAQQQLLTTTPVFDIVFSPAVSLNLYRALQQAQGLTQNDTEANMPSLTEAQLRALYNDQIQDWSLLLSDNGTPLPDFAANAPTDTVVKICRRGNSSGTQASFATQFSRQGQSNSPVVSGVTTFVEPDGGALAGGTAWTTDANMDNFRVWAGASGGDVRSCLDAAHDKDYWALGVLSTENQYQLDDGINNTESPWPGSGSVDPRKEEWRWIKTQGVAPTLENVANGDYDFFTENVINKKNTLADPDLTVVNRLITVLGSPTVIAGINVLHRNTHGDGGLLAVPGTPPANPPYDCTDMRTNPTNTQRRTTNFINPNNKVDTWVIFPSVSGGAADGAACP